MANFLFHCCAKGPWIQCGQNIIVIISPNGSFPIESSNPRSFWRKVFFSFLSFFCRPSNSYHQTYFTEFLTIGFLVALTLFQPNHHFYFHLQTHVFRTFSLHLNFLGIYHKLVSSVCSRTSENLQIFSGVLSSFLCKYCLKSVV